MISESHIASKITFSQFAVVSAPILSRFELMRSIPEAVSSLHFLKLVKFLLLKSVQTASEFPLHSFHMSEV